MTKTTARQRELEHQSREDWVEIGKLIEHLELLDKDTHERAQAAVVRRFEEETRLRQNEFTSATMIGVLIFVVGILSIAAAIGLLVVIL